MVDAKVRKKLLVLMNNAKRRCMDKSNKYYGGRGILFQLSLDDCIDLWIKYNAESMECPSIDRIDNYGNYTSSNCRFVEGVYNYGRFNREKEICKYGHKLEGENIYRRTNGNRDCYICKTQRNRLRALSMGGNGS